MLGTFLDTQDTEENKTNWVLPFMEITVQPRKKHKILNEVLHTNEEFWLKTVKHTR